MKSPQPTLQMNLVVSHSVKVNASPESLWEVLTDPEKIKIYLFGTETITDWNVGSPISFQGNYEGQTCNDKGNVLEVEKNKILKYNYWSSFSGLKDQLENYAVVTYKLEQKNNGQTVFTWRQEGFANEAGECHSENGLKAMLDQIKKIAEV